MCSVGHSLCPSESALPLMLIVACENQCQGYYDVTVGTTVKIPQRKEIILMSEKRISHCQGKGSLTHNNRKFNAKNVDNNEAQIYQRDRNRQDDVRRQGYALQRGLRKIYKTTNHSLLQFVIMCGIICKYNSAFCRNIVRKKTNRI